MANSIICNQPFGMVGTNLVPIGTSDTITARLGIYIKIEQNQFDNPTTHFPSGFLANPGSASFNRSFWKELNECIFLRGGQFDLDWGLVEKETSPGNGDWFYDWTYYDFLLNTIRDLPAITGQEKKALFLITQKTFDIADGTRTMPGYMRNVGTPYQTGWPRYRRMWGYVSSSAQQGAAGQGYHWRFNEFQDGLTGNNNDGQPIYTLRDAYRAFLEAAYNRYRNHPAFAGFMNIESSPTTRVVSGNTISAAFDASEYSLSNTPPPDLKTNNRYTHFAGRLAFSKWMRGLAQDCLWVEACERDNDYVDDMTGAGATDGCLVNRIGFTAPNFHQGTNLEGIYNARINLGGKCIIVSQCQPQDMKDRYGTTPPNYWTWNQTPPAFGGNATTGQPTVSNPNPGTTLPIPNAEWVIDRTNYLSGVGPGILSYQRNLTPAPENPFNYDAFLAGMKASTRQSISSSGKVIGQCPWGGLSIANVLYPYG